MNGRDTVVGSRCRCPSDTSEHDLRSALRPLRARSYRAGAGAVLDVLLRGVGRPIRTGGRAGLARRRRGAARSGGRDCPSSAPGRPAMRSNGAASWCARAPVELPHGGRGKTRGTRASSNASGVPCRADWLQPPRRGHASRSLAGRRRGHSATGRRCAQPGHVAEPSAARCASAHGGAAGEGADRGVRRSGAQGGVPARRQRRAFRRCDRTEHQRQAPSRRRHGALRANGGHTTRARSDLAASRCSRSWTSPSGACLQDGRFRFQLESGDSAIDMRVSIMPSVHGEDAVLRLLDRSHSCAVRTTA